MQEQRGKTAASAVVQHYAKSCSAAMDGMLLQPSLPQTQAEVIPEQYPSLKSVSADPITHTGVTLQAEQLDPYLEVYIAHLEDSNAFLRRFAGYLTAAHVAVMVFYIYMSR